MNYTKYRVAFEQIDAGNDLKTYAKDPDPIIRARVAKNGGCLWELIFDESPIVRREAVKHGKYLNALVGDPDPRVRLEIAKQGKYLKILMYDRDDEVSRAAISYGLPHRSRRRRQKWHTQE